MSRKPKARQRKKLFRKLALWHDPNYVRSIPLLGRSERAWYNREMRAEIARIRKEG